MGSRRQGQAQPLHYGISIFDERFHILSQMAVFTVTAKKCNIFFFLLIIRRGDTAGSTLNG